MEAPFIFQETCTAGKQLAKNDLASGKVSQIFVDYTYNFGVILIGNRVEVVSNMDNGGTMTVRERKLVFTLCHDKKSR